MHCCKWRVRNKKKLMERLRKSIAGTLLLFFANFVFQSSYLSCGHAAIPQSIYRADQIMELTQGAIRDILKSDLSNMVEMADEVRVVTVSALEARQLLAQLPTHAANGQGIRLIRNDTGMETYKLLAQAGGLNISGFHIESSEFKPHREQGKISYYLSKRAKVTVSLLDKEYNQVREIVSEVDQYAGMNTVMWDGRDGSGEIIKDGKYVYEFRAIDEVGNAGVLYKTVKIGVNAPYGTELKEHMKIIQGKVEKEISKEKPKKTKIYYNFDSFTAEVIGDTIKQYAHIMRKGDFFIKIWFLTAGLFAVLVLIAVQTTICGAIDVVRFPFTAFHTRKIDDEEGYREIVEEIKKYNKKLDKEMEERNRKIDKENNIIRNTVIIEQRLFLE